MIKEKVYRFPVTVQLEEKDYECLREDAFKAHVSVSAFTRDLIKSYIAARDDIDLFDENN